MRALADRFAIDLVGGDTNAWDGPLVVSVTLLGEATARGAVRRAGARPGDVVLVTGPLGEASLPDGTSEWNLGSPRPLRSTMPQRCEP